MKRCRRTPTLIRRPARSPDRQRRGALSSLACCRGGSTTLKFALHPWAVELLHCLGGALEGESDAVARRAACYVLTLLLRALGSDALVVLPADMLVRIYRRLKTIRGYEDAAMAAAATTAGEGGDAALVGHVDAALEALRSLGEALAVGGSGGDVEGVTLSADGSLKLPPPSLQVRMPAPLPREPGAALISEVLMERRRKRGRARRGRRRWRRWRRQWRRLRVRAPCSDWP